jgi:hypothetical protein
VDTSRKIGHHEDQLGLKAVPDLCRRRDNTMFTNCITVSATPPMNECARFPKPDQGHANFIDTMKYELKDAAANNLAEPVNVNHRTGFQADCQLSGAAVRLGDCHGGLWIHNQPQFERQGPIRSTSGTDVRYSVSSITT